MFGSDISMMIIPIALIAIVGIFLFMRSKKKKAQSGEQAMSGKKRKQESEAWSTIKSYLKNHDENGKEVVELFVVKRPDPSDSSSLSKDQKKIFDQKQKEKRALEKLEKQQDPKAYKEKRKQEKRLKKPELWMLYFTTRNAKTKEMDEPRIIEAQINYIKKSKKETDRVITVNDKLNFKTEFEWIKPLKEKEDEQELKNRKIQQKKDLKKEAKDKKKDAKKHSKKDVAATTTQEQK